MNNDITTCTPKVAAVRPLLPVLHEPATAFTVAITPSPAQDRLRDYEIQTRMRALLAQGTGIGAEFNALWKEHEQIKNRHAGMPPA